MEQNEDTSDMSAKGEPTRYKRERSEPGSIDENLDIVFFIFNLIIFLEWAKKFLNSIDPLIIELTTAVSKINDFKQVRKLSIKNELVILKDAAGNVVELDTKKHREGISKNYKSKLDNSDFGYTYKTKMASLPLPQLSKAKIELANRIFALVRCPRKEYDQKAQVIYDLYMQGHNQIIAQSSTKNILDFFGSNSGNDAPNPNNTNDVSNLDNRNVASNPDNSNDAPNLDNRNDTPNPDNSEDNSNNASDPDNSNNDPNFELSLGPFISDLQKLSPEEKEERISQKAAAFREFIVKSVELFYIASVSISLVVPFSSFASQFYHTLLF
jgi:hypothetical protein